MDFFDQTHSHDDIVLDNDDDKDLFAKSFDNLYHHITSIVSEQADSMSDKKRNRAILQVFTDFTTNSFIRLQSYSSFQAHAAKGETLKVDDLLLRVRWQVRLRLALWERMGSKAFVSSWMKRILQDLPSKRRRRLQKEVHGTQQDWKLCCEDLTSLLSLAILKSVHERPGELLEVEGFLNSCGLKYIRQQVPWKARLVRDIWTFFDLLHDPNSSHKNVNKSEQVSAVLPPLPVLEEESVRTISTASTVSTNKENASSYFGKRVKLTVNAGKKTNSLLGKSGRTKFMGSHFNTNLTNMSALFRSVPSSRQLPLQKQNEPLARKRPSSRVQVADSPPSKMNLAFSSVNVAETPAPQRKRSRVICETPKDLKPRRSLPL